jgi:hypothetical protein
VFVDPLLVNLYENKYSDLTGTFHYLPGKFEVCLVGFIFIPIWIIHFLFSTNLNIFIEEGNIEEEVEDQISDINPNKSSSKLSYNHRFSEALEQEAISFPKKVIIVSDWSQLSLSKKFVRILIIFLPVLILFGINFTCQYIIGIAIDQKNFNLYNIIANLFVMYLFVFHYVVFMPLMFIRSKVLLEGDYLWSPSCNFVIKNSPSLDLKALNKAIESYDKRYLELLSKGEDPNQPKSSFNIENGKMFWTKSKLGEFSKIVDKNCITETKQKENESIGSETKKSRVSNMRMRHSTFHDDLSQMGTHNGFLNINDSGSIKTDQSKWTENSNDSKLNLKKQEKEDFPKIDLNSQNLMGMNAFSEDETPLPESVKIQKIEPSSDEFVKISSGENSKKENNISIKNIEKIKNKNSIFSVNKNSQNSINMENNNNEKEIQNKDSNSIQSKNKD